MGPETTKLLATTFWIVGNSEMPLEVKKAIVSQLEAYPEAAVAKALMKCQRECNHRLSLADIISRIDDGRPSPNEAWGMIPKCESQSCVWTEEMSTAMGNVWTLMDNQISARMAFLESYKKELDKARDFRIPVKWYFSAGHDAGSRKSVLLEGYKSGKLNAKQVHLVLPAWKPEDTPRLSDGKAEKIKSALAGEMQHIKDEHESH